MPIKLVPVIFVLRKRGGWGGWERQTNRDRERECVSDVFVWKSLREREIELACIV